MAELEQTSSDATNTETHVGYDNATISAGPTSSEASVPPVSNPPVAPQPLIAPPPYVPLVASPFINPALGRLPTMPPVPPSLFMPPQLRGPPVSDFVEKN